MATNHTGSNDQQLRQRRTQAYALPLTADCIVSTKYGGQPLQDSELLQLADSLAKAEDILFQILNVAYISILNGVLNKDDVSAQVDARHSSAQLNEVTEQIHAIQSGTEQFVDTYLADQRILQLYTRAARIVPQLLKADDPINAPGYSAWCRRSVGQLVDALYQTWQDLARAAAQGLINDDTATALRRKLQIYEDILTPVLRTWNDPRAVHSWREIIAIRSQTSNTPSKGISTNVQRYSSTLWLTVFATICNIATFALAYHYSETDAGTAHDSDFWLLLQSSIMQCFALIIAGSALWDKAASWWSMWWWLGPTIIALVASVTAVPLYVSAPMAWSGFATTVASIVQAFMTVQLAAIRR